jgi:enoyl-CoA hydratase/carnithine racemase
VDETKERVLCTDADGVRILTFNRPAVKNAFDYPMYRAVTEGLAGAREESSIGAVVLTGAGSAFSSGQDLKEMAAIATGTAAPGIERGFRGLLEELMGCEKPILAAVNGPAIGFGFTMLPHVDLVLVDPAARFRVPFAELGVPPEAGSSYLLPLLLGRQRGALALLASEWLNADDAVQAGLALRICTPGNVVAETVALAQRIAGYPSHAVRLIKQLMGAADRAAIVRAREVEEAAFAAVFADPERNPGNDLTRGLLS